MTNKKTDKRIPAAARAPKPEKKTVPQQPAPAPTPKPAAKASRSGPLARKKPSLSTPDALASATGTSPMVLAALRSAFGWTDRTRLTRQEFLRKRDEWLRTPASEV